jgi:hypothetical protein
VIRFTRLRTASCHYLFLTKAEVPMFLSRRTHEAPQDQRELTKAELAEVAGGVMCSREPGVQAVMWFATGGMNIGTPSGPFICWG